MSIIIRLKETGEVFDVFPGFKLEMNNTSPFFNDLGSKSVTTTLRNTPRNRRLLCFSNRIDLTDKPRSKMEVIVSSGSYIRDGMLYTAPSDNLGTAFGIIIAFNEGIMYEAMSDILLTELSDLPVIEGTVPELISYLNTLFTQDDLSTDLTVFDAALMMHAYTRAETEVRSFEMLNQYTLVGPALIERTTTQVIDNGEPIEIPVPAGYGMSPFIRVWKVLELIFSHFGYSILENPFKTDFQLQRLCLVNNTLDTIVDGKIRYEQLLPQVTISAFLQSLYGRFGLKVFFNSNTKEISLKLIRNTFRDNTFTPIKLSSEAYPDPAIPRQLKLSGAKNLDRSEVETETYEEFLKKYNNTIGNYLIFSGEIEVGGIYYDRRTGLFYQISTLNKEEKIISSIQFDWNKKDEDLEVEEIITTDECLTMASIQGRTSLYFGLDGTLMNSILTVNGNTINSDNKRLFAFAWDMGEAYDVYMENKLYLGFKYGSIFPFQYNSPEKLQVDKQGNTFKYALTFIGEYGAFNQFFSEYDAFLRHSNRLVKFKIHTSPFDLSYIDFTEKRMINNQPLLLDKVNHDIGGKQSQTVQVEARTLRLYKPYDLAKDHYLPVPDDILFKWVLTANQNSEIDKRYNELYAKFKKQETDNPFYHIFISLSKRIIDDLNPPTGTTFWFLPPTEQQWINNTQVGTRSHTCTVRFTHIYQTNQGTATNPSWVTLSEDLDEIIKYSSWFEPDVIA